MSKRWADVKRLGRDAEAAGHAAWAAATRRGDNIAAPRSSDVQALGVRSQARPVAAQPIRRGDRGRLQDADIAGVVFNETRALSGAGIDVGRRNVAHAVINGDEIHGPNDRPGTAPTRAVVPDAERAIYDAAVAAVAAARAERAQGIDPTNGATHFNFRTNASRGLSPGGFPMRTQTGPFHNSYPHHDLPARDGVYADTYQDD